MFVIEEQKTSTSGVTQEAFEEQKASTSGVVREAVLSARESQVGVRAEVAFKVCVFLNGASAFAGFVIQVCVCSLRTA